MIPHGSFMAVTTGNQREFPGRTGNEREDCDDGKCFFFSTKSCVLLEARVGIEPTNKGFADLCLTTWLPRPRKVTSRI